MMWGVTQLSLINNEALLLALRNGVVPQDTSLIQTGRGQQLMELEHLLDITFSGNGLVKFIGGDYGSGKSFLLKTFQQKAVSRGFVVANIQYDKGLRLQNFHTLYYHIMHNLTTHESGLQKTTFEDLFDHWLSDLQLQQNKQESAAAIQHVISDLNQCNISFSRAVLFYLRARIRKDQELADAAASWLTGERHIPYTLKKKFEIVGDIDDTNAIHFLQSFVRLIRCLGYKGLVVMLDEIELVMNERSDLRQHAYENLRYLIDNSFNGQLPHCLFMFAGTREWFQHQEKGPQTYPPACSKAGPMAGKHIPDLPRCAKADHDPV
jgi:hypothetical protein